MFSLKLILVTRRWLAGCPFIGVRKQTRSAQCNVMCWYHNCSWLKLFKKQKMVHPRSYCHHRNGLVRRLRLVVRGPLIMKLLLVHPLISSFTSPLFWVLFKYLFPLDPSGGRSDQSCMYVLYCIILKRVKSVECDEKDEKMLISFIAVKVVLTCVSWL